MAKKRLNIPSYSDFFIPIIKALQELGGLGSIEEINEKVYEISELTDDILQIPL